MPNGARFFLDASDISELVQCRLPLLLRRHAALNVLATLQFNMISDGAFEIVERVFAARAQQLRESFSWVPGASIRPIA